MKAKARVNELLQMQKVTGADGKQYPASYERKPEPEPDLLPGPLCVPVEFYRLTLIVSFATASGLV